MKRRRFRLLFKYAVCKACLLYTSTGAGAIFENHGDRRLLKQLVGKRDAAAVAKKESVLSVSCSVQTASGLLAGWLVKKVVFIYSLAAE